MDRMLPPRAWARVALQARGTHAAHGCAWGLSAAELVSRCAVGMFDATWLHRLMMFRTMLRLLSSADRRPLFYDGHYCAAGACFGGY